jgi:hypothetical protein
MRILLCALSLFVVLSCSQTGNSEFASAASADELTVIEASQTSPPPDRPVPERMLIRNGSMSFEVKEVTAARRAIVDFTIAADGYIASEKQLSSKEGEHRFELVVRLPGNRVDDFISRIDTMATRVDVRDFSSQDVTEEYVDLESRLRAKRDVEARFREIVKQARTIEEVLEVEQQIGVVHGDIEKIEGRLKYLASKTSFSTVTLNYYEHNTVVVPGIGSKFAESFFEGWNGLMIFLVALTRTWPLLLLVVVVTWVIVRRKRREPKEIIQTQ